MRFFSKWCITLVVVMGVAVSGTAFATNGYFTHGTGTKNKGQVGAGIALPQDAIDIVNNPAVAVEVGDSMELGVALFSPRRSYQSSASLAQGNGGAFTIGPNTIDSDSEFFPIPHFARSWQRSNDSAYALAFYGRGGMNTDWAGGNATFDPDGPGPAPVMTLPGTFGGGTAGVDLSQAFLDLTFAKNISEATSLGASLVIGLQVFEAEGVANFAGFTETFAASGGTVFPSNLSNNGHEFSYGAGFKLGMHTKLSNKVNLGIMYQSEISMKDLDDYADLFAENGGFDIPANAKIGLTFFPKDTVAVSLDLEHTWFSEVDSVGNPIANIFGCPTSPAMGSLVANCLGGSTGAGFGWDDMTTAKIGVQWQTDDEWTWRAGYSHGSQPIDPSEVTFNILAPATIEDHISFGFTKQLANKREINFAFMYAFEEDVTGTNTFDPTQTIKLEMDQWELEFSYGWNF